MEISPGPASGPVEFTTAQKVEWLCPARFISASVMAASADRSETGTRSYNQI